MPNFQTFTRRATPVVATPMVTIQKRATMSLNRSAYEALGQPQAVELLFDPDEQIIGFRGVDPSVRHAYPIRKQPTSYSYLVAGKAFAEHFRIPVGETRRYEAEMIGDVLAIDLKQEATKPVRRDGGKPHRAPTVAAA